MVRKQKYNLSLPLVLGLIAGGSVFVPGMVRAQNDSGGAIRDFQDGGQRGLEDAPLSGDAQEQNANTGVVRLARFSYVKGNVTWRADEGLEWSAAITNLPVRQDAQIWVTDGGRAELQFDDGSVLRLGNGALVTLKTLYSDQDGEFTQITLNEGLATLRARHERGVYRIDTPLASITAKGPAKARFGVADGLEVAIRQGQANLEGDAGKVTLESGDFLDLRDAQSPLEPRRLPREDNWDTWNRERDDIMDGAAQRPSHQHLPANIAIVANELDDYGSWRNDAEYGEVWCPRVTAVDWRPYHEGRWTWVSPFGWTWVSDEAWGWAPYHYGTWVSRSYGWAWCPGPVNQYWSPAVVHFSEYQDRVAWCPLAPREVHYPAALSIGFRSGNWAAFFSIGQAAVYYPTVNNYCEARPFRNGYVNHVTYVNNITNVTNVYNNSSPSFNRYYNSAEFYSANRNTYLQSSHFVPYNARTAAGVSTVAATGFGRRTAYAYVPRTDSAAIFTNGRTVAAPVAGSRPIAGPIAVRPTRESLTPTHTFLANAQPSARAIARPVYQAPLPAAIARRAAPITPSGQVMRLEPARPVTQTGQGGRNLPLPANRESGRPTVSSGNSANGAERALPPSFSTGRGNSNGTGSGTYNRTANGSQTSASNGNTTGRVNNGSANSGYTRRTDPIENSNARTSGSAYNGRSDTGTSSAAEAARRARGSVGLSTGRTSAGTSGNAGNTGSNGTFGNLRGNTSGTQDGMVRRSGGDERTYRPNSGSSTGGANTSGTGNGSNPSGRTANSGTNDTRWSAERARGRGEDSRASSPTTRTGAGTSPRTYSPPTRSENDSNPRSYTPRSGSGSGSGYTPPTPRGSSDGGSRTYSPPARTTPEPSRPSGGSSAPRSSGADASSRSRDSGRERPSERNSERSDKDKGGSDKDRGSRGGR